MVVGRREEARAAAPGDCSRAGAVGEGGAAAGGGVGVNQVVVVAWVGFVGGGAVAGGDGGVCGVVGWAVLGLPFMSSANMVMNLWSSASSSTSV